MTNAQGAAYVMAQAVAALAEIEGMKAENQAREDQGKSQAYDEAAFVAVPTRLGLYHNDVYAVFAGCYDE